MIQTVSFSSLSIQFTSVIHMDVVIKIQIYCNIKGASAAAEAPFIFQIIFYCRK